MRTWLVSLVGRSVLIGIVQALGFVKLVYPIVLPLAISIGRLLLKLSLLLMQLRRLGSGRWTIERFSFLSTWKKCLGPLTLVMVRMC